MSVKFLTTLTTGSHAIFLKIPGEMYDNYRNKIWVSKLRIFIKTDDRYFEMVMNYDEFH